jgi:hypothetical protein
METKLGTYEILVFIGVGGTGVRRSFAQTSNRGPTPMLNIQKTVVPGLGAFAIGAA